MISHDKVRPKILTIVGPTASGKSSLAVSLAKKFDGEVISADSRQVYQGLNLGSGKITRSEMSGIPHHMLDVADPRRQFSAARYKKEAEKALQKILKRGKLPIICGGTGFYIDALLGSTTLPSVPPNTKLRKKLSRLSPADLFKLLKKKDPRRAGEIDRHNPVRLIRALEIIEALGKVPPQKKRTGRYDVLWIGISLPFDVLQRKIRDRLKKRMKGGMLKEATLLHKKGLSWKRMESFGLEYRFMALHLQGKMSRKEMEERLILEIIHYAKRQMRWWKKNTKIKWIDPKQKLTLNTCVRRFYEGGF